MGVGDIGPEVYPGERLSGEGAWSPEMTQLLGVGRKVRQDNGRCLADPYGSARL